MSWPAACLTQFCGRDARVLRRGGRARGAGVRLRRGAAAEGDVPTHHARPQRIHTPHRRHHHGARRRSCRRSRRHSMFPHLHVAGACTRNCFRALQAAELRKLLQAAHPVDPIQAVQTAQSVDSAQAAQAACADWVMVVGGDGGGGAWTTAAARQTT
eukprot:gene8598-biopygen2471